MRNRALGAAAALAACTLAAPPAQAAKRLEPLSQYAVRGVSADELRAAGFDMHETHVVKKHQGYIVAATRTQVRELEAKDATVEAIGRVSTRARAAQAAPDPRTNPTHGYDVFRPWSLQPAPCPGTCVNPLEPLKEIYEDYRRANTDVVRKVTYGRSLLGQPLVAYRVTAGGARFNGARKPVVVYHSTQHAREWLSTEVQRRLFKYVLDHKDDAGTDIPRILRRTQLWFVPVVNPDGYDYTFVSEDTRFWRKNLRDNDADGAITAFDGVDTNRNWPEHWRFDPEGASDDPSSETYRGTGPASEPEVSAYRDLLADLRPKFLIDYHTYGELILYPYGWQVETPSTDDPLFTALAGSDESRPAVKDHDPDLSAELYTTNGDLVDDVYSNFGTLAYTVELSGGYGGPVGGTNGTAGAYTPSGFAFQDDDAAIETEFQDNLQFALDLARSARDPDDPVSHLGNEAPDFVPTTFDTSHGDPQLVEVNAKKALRNVRVQWQVVGTNRRGQERLRVFRGGLRTGEPGVYYQRMRTRLRTGARPGQRVRIQFFARGTRSEGFTYTLAEDSGARVLIMAAEDYTGRSGLVSNTPFPGPDYLDEYEAALQGAGIGYDVWDVDAQGRRAPHWLGVLSHYDAVVWYTGDDLYVRGPDQVRPGGPVSGGGTGTERLFNDEVVNAREYMNAAGGKLWVTGQEALQGSWDELLYNPLGPTPPNPFCKGNFATGNADADDPPGQLENCIAVSNDFIQYWLGAYLPIALETDTPLEETEALGELKFQLDPEGNQQALRSFATTSSLLPDYPVAQGEFKSDLAIRTQAPPAFDPPEGEYYATAASVSSGYQRLTRTLDLTGASTADLSFKLSADTEAGYDMVFVEARTVGQDDYRTLPDLNGNTSEDTGVGCSEETAYWLEENPFLGRYIVRAPGAFGECTPREPGIWNAFTGNSGGFRDWKVDLSQYAGKQVEVSIVYVTDPATVGLGVFVDQLVATANGQPVAQTGFEDEAQGGWTVPGAPEGTDANTGDWTRSTSIGLEDGPGIRTGHSLYYGFGLEGVQGADTRSRLARDAVRDRRSP